MSSIKKIIISTIAVVGVFGITFALINNKPSIADAQVKANKLVNSREKINEIPIVKNKMLKANYNYKYLIGTISESNLGAVTSKINIWIEQPDKFKIDYVPDASQPNLFMESVNNGKLVKTKDKEGTIKEFQPIKPMPTPKVIQDDEVIPDYNGTFLPIGGINELIHPEMLTQSVFRRGEVSLLGEEDYLNRTTTVIRVLLQDSKVSNSQTFWIDNETGIVLKTEKYNADNQVIEVLKFESIEFPAKIDPNQFELSKE